MNSSLQYVGLHFPTLLELEFLLYPDSLCFCNYTIKHLCTFRCSQLHLWAPDLQHSQVAKHGLFRGLFLHFISSVCIKIHNHSLFVEMLIFWHWNSSLPFLSKLSVEEQTFPEFVLPGLSKCSKYIEGLCLQRAFMPHRDIWFI